LDGKKSLKHREKGNSKQPQKVGKKAAEDLISKGEKKKKKGSRRSYFKRSKRNNKRVE